LKTESFVSWRHTHIFASVDSPCLREHTGPEKSEDTFPPVTDELESTESILVVEVMLVDNTTTES
jgi:hypothetical protein